jgi:hypothetical protein
MIETPLWRADLERGEEVRIHRPVLIGYSKPNQFSSVVAHDFVAHKTTNHSFLHCKRMDL